MEKLTNMKFANSVLVRGQSLLEVVFAVGIVAIIILGIVSLANRSLGNSNSSRDRSLASRHVQEMTECLREARDTDWNTFAASAANDCVIATAGVSGEQFRNETITLACFDVDLNPRSCISPTAVVAEASVSIEWEDATGVHEVSSITRYTDWRRQ